MGLSVVYKSNSLMQVVPEETRVKHPPQKQKSLYTLAREDRFRKAALKKYASEINEIRQYFPDWEPGI